MKKPVIMISSTYYDLKQLRNEIKIFIEGIGYDPMLSESPAFPITPGFGTLENCKTNVKELADIFVLIIGGRYGYIDKKTDKSITNIEYIEARNKGIPIYVFIDSKVLANIATWKENPDGNFSSVVDNVGVFSFIEQIRNTDSVWTFQFDTINDIKTVLTNQFAFLFKKSLDDSNRIKGIGNEKLYENLKSKALILVIEKPKAWEYLLYFQVWCDEIENINEKIYEYENGLFLVQTEYIPDDQIFNWIHTRFHEITKLIETENMLINVKAQEAFGPPGVSGDQKLIIMASRNLVKTLSLIIDWSIRIRSVKANTPFAEILEAMSKMTDSAIRAMMDFPKKCLMEYDRIIPLATNENPQTLTLTLTLEISNMDEFNRALKKAREVYGLLDEDE